MKENKPNSERSTNETLSMFLLPLGRVAVEVAIEDKIKCIGKFSKQKPRKTNSTS